MDNDDPDFLDPVAFDGAMKGVRAGLSMYGIEVDEEICTQVAITVLTGFALKGGLEPESLERLRDLVVRAATARQEH